MTLTDVIGGSRNRIGGNNSFYGKHHSEETKHKLSQLAKERIKEKNAFYGKHHTEETKNKIRVAHLGKPNLKLRGRSFSEEHRKNLSNAKKKLFLEGKLISPSQGKPLSEETKRKIGLANKGRLLGDNNPFRKIMLGPRREEFLRKNSEGHKGLQIREKNPAWLGGKSFEPYCPKFNNEFKNLIKLRDNFCCIECGISEQTHIILKLVKLVVHHIDYNKKNTCIQNCCTLCSYHHGLTNFNRKHWIEYLQEKLTNKYNYQYSKEEIIVNK